MFIFSLNIFIFLISSFLKTHFKMKATCSHKKNKKQCFDVSEIIFKLKKSDFFLEGGGGFLILKMILVIKTSFLWLLR